jgi:hypothetical protein
MKKLLLLTIFLLCNASQFLLAQDTRYLDEIFTDVDVNSDVIYGNNITVFPTLLGQAPGPQDLTMDIYSPAGDTETNRPVVIMLHTGSFLPAVLNGQATGSKTDNAIVAQCESFAKKGFVAVAISYRLGWNPTSTNADVRRRTLIQAALRGLQDTRTAIRFLRKSSEEGNPYGISCQFVVGGLGTGGYVSLAAASLNDYATELTTPKFMDTSMDIDGDGETDLTDVTLCIPNHIGYSSNLDMVFNIGGAIPDSAWINANEAPIASMQCYLDEDAPYEVGNIVVPTTGEIVIEGHGSLAVQRYATNLGNNSAFDGLSMSINDSWYGNGDGAANSAIQIQAVNVVGTPIFDSEGNPVWESEGHDVYHGLFPIVAPTGDELEATDDCINCGEDLSVCLFNWNEQGAPWDWWNNDTSDPLGYPLAATQNPLASGDITADIYACQSTLGNPDMSEAKGMAFATMIQEFICPRIYAALDLGNLTNECNINENKIFQNLVKTIDVTGREIKNNSKEKISFKIYDNGEVTKQYLIK